MKNILGILIFCTLHQMGFSQNFTPTIKNNTTLNYVCKLHGQTRTLALTAKMKSDTLVFDLKTRGVESSIKTMPEAVKNGIGLSFNQGESAPVINLKPTETFFMISQSAYKELVNNGKFIYNNTTYVLDKSEDKNPVVIDGKTIATLHVVAQIDETEIWILQNPDFPLLCKMAKSPLGINFTLTNIMSN